MSGFSTWDMADIYGPAEEFLGKFRKGLDENELSKVQALTKFVPSPGPMSRSGANWIVCNCGIVCF